MNRHRLLKCAASYPLAVLFFNSPAFASTGPWTEKRRLATGLSSPVGMAIDPQGAVIIANWSAGTIVRVGLDGKTSTLAGGLSGPSGLAISSKGDIYIASYSQDLVWRLSPNGGKPEVLSRDWPRQPACLSTMRETC